MIGDNVIPNATARYAAIFRAVPSPLPCSPLARPPRAGDAGNLVERAGALVQEVFQKRERWSPPPIDP